MTDKNFNENPSRAKMARKGPNCLFEGQKKTNFDSSHIWFTVHEFPVITQKNYYIRVFAPSRSIVKSTQFNAKLALLVSSDVVKFLKTWNMLLEFKEQKYVIIRNGKQWHSTKQNFVSMLVQRWCGFFSSLKIKVKIVTIQYGLNGRTWISI